MISKRKLKNGATVFDVTVEVGRGTRHREKRTFQSLEDAKLYEQAEKRKKLRKRSGILTVSEYIDGQYWPIASRRLEATSLDTYEKEIRLRIKPSIGDILLSDLTRKDIQGMLDCCATESVARKALGTLKTILNEAVSDGFMDANPALSKYALPKRKGKRDNGLVLTNFRDIASFIAQVQNDAPEAITRLVMTGLMLGLRPEERFALDYEDFDFEEGTVTIKAAYVTASKERGGNQLKGTKTAYSSRIIPMPKQFADWFYFTDGGHGPWITNAHGQRLSPSTARKMWYRYLAAHPELPRITMENMRHSFATACLHAGMNVADLSRMLGHSDINTTFRRYVKPDLENIREGLAKIPYE